MNYKDKILQCTNRIADMSKSIADFKEGKSADQKQWGEKDLDKLLRMESRLRDAKKSLKAVHEDMDKKFIVKDHRSGKLVRI